MSLLKTFDTNIISIHEIDKKGDLKSLKNLVSNGADVNRKDVFKIHLNIMHQSMAMLIF